MAVCGLLQHPLWAERGIPQAVKWADDDDALSALTAAALAVGACSQVAAITNLVSERSTVCRCLSQLIRK